MSNTKMSAKSYLLVSDMKWSGRSILWWCNFETLSAKLTGLSDGLSPNCFTLSNPTQIATFEAIPLSGINCQLLANGIQIHFHSASNSFSLCPRVSLGRQRNVKHTNWKCLLPSQASHFYPNNHLFFSERFINGSLQGFPWGGELMILWGWWQNMSNNVENVTFPIFPLPKTKTKKC